jgi:hypothetical protein
MLSVLSIEFLSAPSPLKCDHFPWSAVSRSTSLRHVTKSSSKLSRHVFQRLGNNKQTQTMRHGDGCDNQIDLFF